MKTFVLLIAPALLISCTGDKDGKEYADERYPNLKGEFIYRRHDESLMQIPPPERKQQDPYPWEKEP